MGRSSMSIVKRQRELKKAERAAQKRAKKHGTPEQREFTEPQPTVRLNDTGIVSARPAPVEDDADDGPSDDE